MGRPDPAFSRVFGRYETRNLRAMPRPMAGITSTHLKYGWKESKDYVVKTAVEQVKIHTSDRYARCHVDTHPSGSNTRKAISLPKAVTSQTSLQNKPSNDTTKLEARGKGSLQRGKNMKKAKKFGPLTLELVASFKSLPGCVRQENLHFYRGCFVRFELKSTSV